MEDPADPSCNDRGRDWDRLVMPASHWRKRAESASTQDDAVPGLTPVGAPPSLEAECRFCDFGAVGSDCLVSAYEADLHAAPLGPEASGHDSLD